VKPASRCATLGLSGRVHAFSGPFPHAARAKMLEPERLAFGELLNDRKEKLARQWQAMLCKLEREKGSDWRH